MRTRETGVPVMISKAPFCFLRLVFKNNSPYFWRISDAKTKKMDGRKWAVLRDYDETQSQPPPGRLKKVTRTYARPRGKMALRAPLAALDTNSVPVPGLASGLPIPRHPNAHPLSLHKPPVGDRSRGASEPPVQTQSLPVPRRPLHPKHVASMSASTPASAAVVSALVSRRRRLASRPKLSPIPENDVHNSSSDNVVHFSDTYSLQQTVQESDKPTTTTTTVNQHRKISRTKASDLLNIYKDHGISHTRTSVLNISSNNTPLTDNAFLPRLPPFALDPPLPSTTGMTQSRLIQVLQAKKSLREKYRKDSDPSEQEHNVEDISWNENLKTSSAKTVDKETVMNMIATEPSHSVCDDALSLSVNKNDVLTYSEVATGLRMNEDEETVKEGIQNDKSVPMNDLKEGVDDKKVVSGDSSGVNDANSRIHITEQHQDVQEEAKKVAQDGCESEEDEHDELEPGISESSTTNAKNHPLAYILTILPASHIHPSPISSLDPPSLVVKLRSSALSGDTGESVRGRVARRLGARGHALRVSVPLLTTPSVVDDCGTSATDTNGYGAFGAVTSLERERLEYGDIEVVPEKTRNAVGSGDLSCDQQEAGMQLNVMKDGLLGSDLDGECMQEPVIGEKQMVRTSRDGLLVATIDGVKNSGNAIQENVSFQLEDQATEDFIGPECDILDVVDFGGDLMKSERDVVLREDKLLVSKRGRKRGRHDGRFGKDGWDMGETKLVLNRNDIKWWVSERPLPKTEDDDLLVL
ncbi:hypothetical protein BC830DRAFT_507330 [Chytriomyces sp. MP71]|nr:hypothetical protein BC830DRAFT_507330 [Chytriomyces sp. MP71]